jgi:hypothetical protein
MRILLIPLVLAFALPALGATPLNDTGITLCGDYAYGGSGTHNKDVDCSLTTDAQGDPVPAGQDGHFGADAAAMAGVRYKIGGGEVGFDFTKIGADGTPLVIQDGVWDESGSEAAGTKWDCVRDNVTALMWEVKRNDVSHLRHRGHTYTWYNPDGTTNGGRAGTQDGGSCGGTSACDTQGYVAAVNAAGLCGHHDWRMPDRDELRSIVHYGRVNPAIDAGYFPNAVTVFYGSSSPYASVADFAWGVDFNDGYDRWNGKDDVGGVRLVRAGQ